MPPPDLSHTRRRSQLEGIISRSAFRFERPEAPEIIRLWIEWKEEEAFLTTPFPFLRELVRTDSRFPRFPFSQRTCAHRFFERTEYTSMGYHPRIEWKEEASFLTTRSRNSRLWFVNNRVLEDAILGYAARYSKRYSAKIYALAIEGNHVQGTAHFPEGNRADFMRDLNSTIARAVARYVPEYEGGRFWARRYSAEMVPGADDVEDRFFYTVLQPVQDGLVEKISEYPGYNCFHDAIWGVKRKFKVVRWGEYNAAKRYNRTLSIKDYTEIVTLEYARIPGYEHLSRRDYALLMQEQLEKRRVKIVSARRAAGKGFLGREKLLNIARGAYPKSTKTSTRQSHRPRVLCVCPKRRKIHQERYFSAYFEYKAASKAYREGDLDVRFPQGTYKPYCWRLPPQTESSFSPAA